ncbi:MAG: sulfite exporter TauE/SafE family protein [Burkholderiales bacterium]|nr:sulfite exporter TauE/SafE family protein [Burkholderiales bacterium]
MFTIAPLADSRCDPFSEASSRVHRLKDDTKIRVGMEYLTLLMAGALSGLVAGLAGLGGGTVIVPVLVWLYGDAALHDAIVVSWFAVLFNSASAATRQYKLRSSEERSQLIAASKYFLIGVLVVTPITALVLTGIPSVLTPTIVGALQITLAAALMWQPAQSTEPRTMNKAFDTGWGALVAAASTLIGIGGGAYTTAYMVYGPRRPLRDAIAAGNFTGLAVGALSVVGYLASVVFVGNGGNAKAPGLISGVGMALLLGSGVVCSAIGVKLSRNLPTALLKKILVGLLAVSAVRLLIS